MNDRERSRRMEIYSDIYMQKYWGLVTHVLFSVSIVMCSYVHLRSGMIFRHPKMFHYEGGGAVQLPIRYLQ